MVTFVEGSIFDSKAQTITNAVNCVGVMGKGIALEFKRRFPEMFKDYAARCRDSELVLGKPYLYKSSTHQWILNFPTKDHWKSPSELASVVSGLNVLKDEYQNWGIKSLAMPALGCGLGGLDWEDVSPVMLAQLSQLSIDVEIYLPVISKV